MPVFVACLLFVFGGFELAIVVGGSGSWASCLC